MSHSSIFPKYGLRCFRFARSIITLRGDRWAVLAFIQISAAAEKSWAVRGLEIRLKAPSNSLRRDRSASFATVLLALFDDSRIIWPAKRNLYHQTSPRR